MIFLCDINKLTIPALTVSNSATVDLDDQTPWEIQAVSTLVWISTYLKGRPYRRSLFMTV